MSDSKREQKSPWAKTPITNLLRYRASSVYFARVGVAGKLIRQSLKTHVFSVAKIRLPDFTQEQRKAAEVGTLSACGKMSFGDARRIYEERLKNNQRLKAAAEEYRMRTIEDLGKTWPGLNATDVRKSSERECLEWAAKYAEKYSPTVYNNTVGTLRHVLEIGVRAGARYGNPANAIPKLKVRQKVHARGRSAAAGVHRVVNEGNGCYVLCLLPHATALIALSSVHAYGAKTRTR